MTTDCFTELHVEDRKQGASLAELGAAAITAVGFVLLLPAASFLLSLLAH